MQSISDELKERFKHDYLPYYTAPIHKDITIYFPDLDLTIDNTKRKADTFELEESLTEDGFNPGQCNAAICKFTAADVDDDIVGQEFTVTLTVDDEDISLGTFVVDSASKTNDLRYKDVTAYDRMTYFDKNVINWYLALSFPTTVKTLRDGLCEQCGVEQTDIALPNDDMEIDQTVESGTLNGLDVLKAICEVNGCFGHMGRGGVLEYIFLDATEADDTIPAETSMELEYEEYTVRAIDKFQIYADDDNYSTVITSGTAVNAYTISGNFLLYGKGAEELTEIANNIADLVMGITYKPYTDSIYGLPYLDVGDCVTFGDKFTSFIFKRTLTGCQSLRDELSADGDEYREQNKVSVSTQYAELKASVAQTKSSVQEAFDELSELMANGKGLYTTEDTDESGATIYYLHDQPELSESTIIWKMTADAFAVSTDGGQTWNLGLRADGEMIAKKLSAVGINAEWIITGDLSVGGSSANTDGSILIYDADDNVICQINSDGIVVTAGTIAGWTISSTKLTSSNGQMVIDSANRRITCGDSSGTQARYSESGEGIWYDDEHLGDFGFMRINWTDDTGVTDELRGYVIGPKVWATDTCMGYGIVAWDSTAEMYQRQMFYDWQEEWFYFYKPVTVLALTQDDPYYTKDITFDDDNQSFTMTVGRGATDDTTYDVTNTFVYSLDDSGRITAITNQTTGKTTTVNYS